MRNLPGDERQDQESQRETVIGRPCVGGSVSGRSPFSSVQLAMNRRHGVDNQAVKARRLVLENLTPGAVYAIQMWAVGGSTGHGNGDPVSHMAM